MTGRITGSMNENGDDMKKTTNKIQTILLGTIIVLLIIFINSCVLDSGGEKGRKKEESRQHLALEQALMEIEGVGEVSLYFHYENGEQESTLSDLLSLSTTSEKRADNLQGILVNAEGAGNPKIRNELSRILSTVLQVPEHRIVIVEMKKRGNTDESK